MTHVLSDPCSDRDTVLRVVRRHPDALAWACRTFTDDLEVVLTAVARNHAAFLHSTVPHTRPFLVDCVLANASVMDYLPGEYATDRTFALSVVAKGGRILSYLSDVLRDDRDVVMAHIRIEEETCPEEPRPYGFIHASDRLRHDRDVILAAVRSSGSVVKYIRERGDYTCDERERFLSDVEIITAAVENHGDMIAYASRTCRLNRIVVMTALTSEHPANWEFVPYPLLSDPCIGLCISYAQRKCLDVLLSALDFDLTVCNKITCDEKLAFKHATERPFTSRTVLALFGFDMSRCAFVLSTRDLDALAAYVNRCTSDRIYNIRNVLTRILVDNYGVVTDADMPNLSNWDVFTHWPTMYVDDSIPERVQRLGQVADALPYIDRALQRNSHLEDVDRVSFRERVDDMAARLYHPQNLYAKFDLARDFASDFA